MGSAAENKEYNYCLDVLKGIACIFVVFMHCEFPGLLGTAVQCVSRFCVPFFFMVSGYYYFHDEQWSREEKRSYALRKIRHLGGIILPAVCLYLAFAVVRGGVTAVSAEQIVGFVLFNQPFIIAGQLWFLFALLYDYLVFAVIDRFDLREKSYYCIPVLMAAYICLAQGAHLAGISVQNMYYRNFLVEGLCFFLLGNWIRSRKDRLNLTNRALLAVIILSTLLCPVERMLMGRDFGVNIVTFPQVTALFLYGLNNPTKGKGSVLGRLGGKLSMLVYIFHPAVWHTLEAVYAKLHWNQRTSMLYLMPVLVVGLTIACAVIYRGVLGVIKKRNGYD